MPKIKITVLVRPYCQLASPPPHQYQWLRDGHCRVHNPTRCRPLHPPSLDVSARLDTRVAVAGHNIARAGNILRPNSHDVCGAYDAHGDVPYRVHLTHMKYWQSALWMQ
jgi:hypothetical protein